MIDFSLPRNNQNGKIIAIGELLVDFIPGENGMRISDSGSVIKTASGSSGIVACAAAKLGADAGFVGKIGKDSLSKFVYNTIKEQDVDLSRVCMSDSGQIGLAFIEYTNSGRNYQYYRENSVGSKLSPEDLDFDYIKSAFAVHYAGMLLELTPQMQQSCIAAVEAAREGGALVSFDPNIRKELMKNDGALKRLKNAVETADIISPTFDEARFITGKDNILEILRELHAMGPSLIALTRDKDGAALSNGKQIVYADGIDIEPVDPTGAGDTFAAAICCGLQQGMDLSELACFCNCAGTMAIMKRGAIGMALPERGEVIKMMKSGICKVQTAEFAEKQTN